MIKNLSFGLRICYALLIISLFSCKDENRPVTLFFQVPTSQTNIDFENTLINSDDFNIIEYLYFYNGGGVSTGDINNDGLSDIYFTSNQGSNRLYLNKGNFQFEDITTTAGVSGEGNWKTGVSMADVNGDGFLDIFICGVGNYKKFNGRNQLFINNGDLTFTDRTTEYGLSFQGFSTQATFFDYDNDGDLDMYLANHSVHTPRSYGRAMLRFEIDPLAGDKLYRNELVPTGKVHFKDATSQAGILSSQIGFGLGVGISDLNKDGYIDIYVSNDFNENDYLYINQRNGTFRQELQKAIPHSSRFSMGNDIADINNDQLPDIITLDMLPKDEEVIKTTAGEDAYEIYEFKLRYGYHYQFARNALQLNRGLNQDSTLMFSDIAPFAGVEASDWSWGPLLADFDNDGYKDLFISNGIVGRPNDLDYINYISSDSAQLYFSDQQLIDQMPSGEVSNEFFRNNGDLTFRDASTMWLGSEKSFSNGAAYADLDNDGDLDLVVNNINKKAFIYRNDLAVGSSHYLKIKLEGDNANKFGIGAQVCVFAGGKKLLYEQVPTRGWLSSVDYVINIGLGTLTTADSIFVRWPDNRTQTLHSVQSNQTLVIKQSVSKNHVPNEKKGSQKMLFTRRKDIDFKHKENSFIAFSIERLIPHMISTQGPRITAGDINNDALDDFFIGGGVGQSGEIFIQDNLGNFNQSTSPSLKRDSTTEDTGSALFDADGDGYVDLVVVSGGQELMEPNKNITPRLYLNDRKGNFNRVQNNLPDIFVNSSCVIPGDVDNDGDKDLFIGGRVVAGKYGVDPPSFILINTGKGFFKDETKKLMPFLKDDASLGMVSDALWVDVNNDQRLDMIVVGEWMPITVLIQNESGTLENKTSEYGLSHTNGWWNTIAAYDFDKDGDLDFIAGNLGLNSRLRASEQEPVSLYVGDADSNNSIDHILTYFNQGKKYPFVSRDQLIKQIPSLKRKFLKFSNYKNVTLEDIIPPAHQQKFIQKDAFTFASAYIENLGNGKFSINSLPHESQFFPVFSFGIEDVNDDGNADILAVGNFDATQPEIGRYDAGYGVVLLGDGKGQFLAVEPQTSGFVVNGEGRDIKILRSSANRKLFLISRNNDTVKSFQHTKK